MENTKPENWNNPNESIPVFKVDPVKVLILGFITCGLYLIHWNIKTAEVLNAVAGRKIISKSVAVFAGCCLPVNIYFFYVAGKDGLPEVYKRIGIQKDDSTLLIVLGLFFPMVAAMMVQGDINKLYK